MTREGLKTVTDGQLKDTRGRKLRDITLGVHHTRNKWIKKEIFNTKKYLAPHAHLEPRLTICSVPSSFPVKTNAAYAGWTLGSRHAGWTPGVLNKY